MKKTVKLIVVGLLFIIGFIGLASCNSEATGPKHGSLRLNTGGEVSRTIEPQEEEIIVASYRVSGSGPSEESYAPTIFEESPILIEGLLEGSWNITVEGLNDTGVPIASEMLSVDILSGVQTDKSFVLKWLEGFGHVNITILWPNGLTSFTKIHGVISQEEETIKTFELLATDATVASDMKSITQSYAGLATGSYDFVLTFHDDNNSLVGLPYMEQINIYSGLTSEGVCEIPEVLLPIETPVISPPGGRIGIGEAISITSASSNVAIYYTTDGSSPTAGSTLYTGSFVLDKNAIVKAIALDPTRFASAITTAEFEVPVAAPTYTIGEGTYESPLSLSMNTTTNGAIIHYTLDGSDPTSASATYSSALAINENTTVRAIALHKDYGDSDITTAEYKIRAGKPSFSLDDSNPMRGTQTLVLFSGTDGATILYTLNGSDPVTLGQEYSEAITLNTSTTVKAVAKKPNMENSVVITKNYSIPPIAATPVITPSAGTYSTPQEVSITTSETGGEIRYTIDGNTPNSNSLLYDKSFIVSANTTVKAITLKTGYWDSDVATNQFNIQAAVPVFNPGAGSFNGAQTVVITSDTDGATIRYTIDDTEPTHASTVYTTALTVPKSVTIKAYSSKEGMTDSDVVTAEYIIYGSSGVNITDPSRFKVDLQLPASWSGNTIASNAGGIATASVSPAPSTGEVTYTWYLDGAIAKNNDGDVASTGPTLQFGSEANEVSLGSGPHLLAVKVAKGSMSYSDQKIIVASLERTTYVVFFDSQGGSVASPTAMTVTNGFPYGTLATTARVGYDFTGWWTNSGGTGTKVTETATVDIGANQTLFAGWIPATYTVTFDSDGGETPDPESKQVTYTATYGALPVVERSGYSFGGWWTEKDGEGVGILATATVDITEDITLYAKWIPPIQVAFNAQGGQNLTPTSKTVMYGEPYGELATTIKVGHTLEGWWTEEGGAGEEVTAETMVSTQGNQILYAKWTPNVYTVQFNSQGGSDVDSIVAIYGQPYGALPQPTRESHIFKGWYTQENRGGVAITSETTYAQVVDQTLYAGWWYDVWEGPAGGLVFYENPNYEDDGWRYLEAAPHGWYQGETDSDGVYKGPSDPYFQWGVYGIAIGSEARGTAIGTGASNTAKVVEFHDTLWQEYPEKGDFYQNPTAYYSSNDGTVAAKICTELSIEKDGVIYNDWFLPSKDELNEMYKTLHKEGLGGFSDNAYWSSSESNGSYAWLQDFDYGEQDDYYRRNAFRVRPVRAF